MPLFDDDAAFMAWVEHVRLNGEICRLRLFGVDTAKKGWPQDTAPLTEPRRQLLPDGDQF